MTGVIFSAYIGFPSWSYSPFARMAEITVIFTRSLVLSLNVISVHRSLDSSTSTSTPSTILPSGSVIFTGRSAMTVSQTLRLADSAARTAPGYFAIHCINQIVHGYQRLLDDTAAGFSAT